MALAIADRVPQSLLLAAGRLLGSLAWALLRGPRRTARDNVRLVLAGGDNDGLARRSFVAAGENLATCLLLRRRSFRALELVRVAPDARSALDAALAERRGVVFISAHLGPFELLPAALSELGYQPAVVVRESYDPALNDIVDAHRRSRGVEVIHRGVRTATVRLARALKAGRPVGILPDLGGRVRSVPATFLGQRVDVPLGPQRVALRSGAAVVVGTLRRRSSATRTQLPCFELEIVKLAGAVHELELTRRISSVLSHAILSSPEDWLWMAPRFRRLQ
jgi:KDO2-lipid IV(A) lauroyltransferase